MNRFIYLIKQQQLALRLLGSMCVLFGVLCYAIVCTYHDWKLSKLPLPVNQVNHNNTEQQEWLKKIDALPNQNLFGKMAEAPDTSVIPISSLQIKITGIAKTVGTETPELSSVLMSVSGQPAKVYRVNEEIASGVKIQDITNDAVIFNRQGKLEKILLPRKQLEFKPRPPSRLLP